MENDSLDDGRLVDALDQVIDRETFLAFVRALLKDRLTEVGRPVDDCGRGVNGWENHTIESFLEAALAWAHDSDFGDRQYLKDASPWQRVANFLYCGKIYE